nr:transposase [Miltoncostaea marina]
MVVFGVDAHKASFAIAGIDAVGRQLCADTFSNDPEGHQALLAWARDEAPGDRRFGIEGAGSFGRALALALIEAGERVVEVPTKLTDTQRARMAGQGKSDARDALAAARVALREGDRLVPIGPELPGARELKLLGDYRRQLIGERTRTANRLHADLVVICPGYERHCGALRARYQLRRAGELLAGRPDVHARLATRRLERLVELDAEIRDLGREIAERVRQIGTGLVALVGIGPITPARSSARCATRAATPPRISSPAPTAPRRSRHRVAPAPAIASTAAGTAASTMPCT